MDRQHFNRQMKRLADTFGVKSYGDERVDLIFREVNQLSNEWMVRTVDLFIGELDRPPLLPKFREEIAKERERLWQSEKRQHSTEARQAMSVYCNDDLKMICKTITARVEGKIKDSDWECHLKLLKSVPETIEEKRRWSEK